MEILAVIFVLGLLGGTLWWLRSRGMAAFAPLPRRKEGGALESLERLPLAPGHTLHLVRVGDRAIVIAASPSGCRVMTALPSAALLNRGEVRR